MDLISYVPRLPTLGETLHGTRFSMGYGGKGANQCIVSARLGAKTAMVGKLGTDIFGQNYMKNFEENMVDTQHVTVTKEAATGVAPIAVDEKGQNSIVIVSGANMLLSKEDIMNAENLIKSAKVLLCQLEVLPSTTLLVMQIAKKHGITTIFNPAPAIADLSEDFYKACDIICPNESEAEILTGIPVKLVSDAEAAIAVLLDRGCSTAIITLGTEGAVFASHQDRKMIHVPAEKVEAVDTTGAGDAFIGGLAYYFAKHPELTLQEKVRRAGRIATTSVMAPGTQTSYPQSKDLPEELFQ